MYVGIYVGKAKKLPVQTSGCPFCRKVSSSILRIEREM